MRRDSPFAYQPGDGRFDGWVRWAIRRGLSPWVIPIGFFVLVGVLFGLTMLGLFLFLPKGNVGALTAQVDKVPGVQTAQLTQNGDRYRILNDDLTVHLKPGATVQDPKAFVKYLFGVTWAASGGEPDLVEIHVDGGANVNVFMSAVEDGWNTAGGEGRAAQVDNVDLRAVLGPYPGKTPTAPTGMIALPRT